MDSAVVKCFVCNPYMQNTYVVHMPGAKEGIIIDAGMYTQEEEKAISDYIQAAQLSVEAALITHSHRDHICGKQWIARTYPNAKIVDCAYLKDTYKEEEPELHYAGMTIRCLYTPGHLGDSVCYMVNETILFSGDTLFRQSVGRTDMEGGDYFVLMQSLQYLMHLPAETIVYPGHSEATTIGYELRYNPFI